ncbi:CheR family methyltransferase [Paucibacter soli]|uniref:CheR family methyltransferase n=1 Tax=Paucibacter soli TaxID=3133433 RepID=UPI00309A20D7
MNKALAQAEALLRQRLGLDAGVMSSATLRGFVTQRMSVCGASDHRAYWELLQHSELELQALVELTVVAESWFMRDPEALAALGRLAVQRRRHAGPPLRLASLPCAAGEEPHSMAIALFDAGLAAQDFSIDGVDISQAALARAQMAEYGPNALRGCDAAFCARHFETLPSQARQQLRLRLKDEIRRQVRWRHGNLLDAQLLAGEPPYDMVFCRNLLIYLRPEAQQRLLQRLHALLKEDGLLFLAPAETALPSRQHFQTRELAGVFAFQRSRPHAPLARPAMHPQAMPPPVVLATPQARTMRPPPAAARLAAAPTLPAASLPTQPASLEAATAAANAGQLALARQLCERLLQSQANHADAWQLLAVITAADGEADAALDCLRKALYLNPEHEPALTQLVLQLRARGDAAAARAEQRLQLLRARRAAAP